MSLPLLLLAYLAFVSIALPDGLLGVTWPAMRLDLHQPVGAVGLLLPFAVASSMLSSAATGVALARVGIGRLLAASTALAAAALLGQSLAPAFWLVIAAAVVLAIGSGAIDAGLNAYAARHFDARRITWLHACYGLGAAVGPLAVAGTTALGLSWRWAFGLVAATQFPLALAFAATARAWPPAPPVPPPLPRAQPAAAQSERPAPRAVWPGAALFALQSGLESSTALWAYVYLTGARGVPADPAALTVSAYWAALVVGRLVLGPVADRHGPYRVLGAGLAGMGVGAVLVMLPGAVSSAGIVLLGFAAAPMFPLLTLTTRDRLGAGRVDRAIGVQVAASAAGAAIAPAAIGVLVDRYGAAVLGPCLLVLAVATTIAYVTATPRR